LRYKIQSAIRFDPNGDFVLKTFCLCAFVVLSLAACNTPDIVSNAPDAGSSPVPSVTSKKMWVSKDLAFATVDFADSVCRYDEANPGILNAKALIVDKVHRVACTSPFCATSGNSEHVDWVLKPNTPYVRLDGTLIAITDSNALITSPMQASVSDSGQSGDQWGPLVTTLLKEDWTGGCEGNPWPGGRGGFGGAYSTVNAFFGGMGTCSGPDAVVRVVYCVEQ
jgi:hypothetical protein